ncbi:aspartyl/glutamyl-tRNA amidotransferase subunit C [Mycobacterium tuberculosis]|nr:aspartyl/glutamyl-tRNA amidotransferase subunit C [Mycobacterium tuberculosis]
MSVDAATVRRIAHLARIAVKEDEVSHLQGELNAMLAFVEQLTEVDIPILMRWNGRERMSIPTRPSTR